MQQAALSAVGIPAALRCMASCLARWLMKADRFRTRVRVPVSATTRSTLATAASPSSARWARAHRSAVCPSCASRRASSADNTGSRGAGHPGEDCIPPRPERFRV